jgi:predicted RNase H-like nuclease
MYRARLRSLQTREPQLKYSAEVRKAIGVDIADFTGTRYKALDDLLDGIFCAYLAYYFWYWGEEGCWVVGATGSGYVTLPRCQSRNCPLTSSI